MHSTRNSAPLHKSDIYLEDSSTAVAKLYQRFSAEAKTNKPLRKLLKELTIYLSSVKD